MIAENPQNLVKENYSQEAEWIKTTINLNKSMLRHSETSERPKKKKKCFWQQEDKSNKLPIGKNSSDYGEILIRKQEIQGSHITFFLKC